MKSYIVLLIVLSSCFVISEKVTPIQGQTITTEKYYTGIISWSQDRYPVNNQGVIQVIDKDMSINPNEINHLQVHIWSYSDAHGIDINLAETKPGSGEFQGTVYFTGNPPSNGNTLYVSNGDKVTAQYNDAYSNIGTPVPLEKKIDIINPSTTGPSTTGPSTTGPSTTGPSTTGPSTTGPSTTGPSTIPSWVVPVAIGTAVASAVGIAFAVKSGILGGGSITPPHPTPKPDPTPTPPVNPIQSIRIEIKGGLEK